MTDPVLLEVSDLKTYFDTPSGTMRAVDGVSFTVKRGEIVGIVGESGSGKSVLSRSILRLVRQPPGRYAGGEIRFEGRDLLKLSEAEMRELRGNSISMIFQEPITSLNPVMTIGAQIAEALVLHQKLGAAAARKASIDLLTRVGISSPELRVDAYPCELSGGMCQRAMIAMALACRPRLLIADEPTTALDVTIQAQILELLRHLREEFDMGIILITHNLGLIAEMADRVVVMYAGHVVESASVEQFFASPRHPYSRGLMASLPRLDQRVPRLAAIEGSIQSAAAIREGCAFQPRCAHAMACCATKTPAVIDVDEGHQVACWLEVEQGVTA